MKMKTQREIMKLLVFSALILAFIFSFFASGLLEEKETETNISSVLDYSNTHVIPAEYMTIKVNGMMVATEYTGPSGSVVEWNYGDGIGQTAKSSTLHEYDTEGKYLVTLYARMPDGVQNSRSFLLCTFRYE